MRIPAIFVTAITLLSVIHAGAFAQAAPDPAQEPQPGPPEFSARVQVVFDLHETLKGSFKNCIVQNLLSLGDVVVTDESPQYRLTIMGLPNMTGEENIGFTFSVLVTRPFDVNLLRPLLLSEDIGENDKKMLFLLGKNYERIEKNSLLTTSPERLGRTCAEIVRGFNIDVLEKDRRLWRSVWSLPPTDKEDSP